MKYLLILLALIALGFGGYYLFNKDYNHSETSNITANDSTEEANLEKSGMESSKNTTIEAPVAKKIPHEMTIHGDTRVDNYYWMRDDKREDPEILGHLEAENAYKDAMLAHTESLQEKLYQEMVGRLEKDNSEVPAQKGDYWYYRRFEAEKEYPIYARKKNSLEADEEILLDVNQLAQNKGYYNVAGLSVSPNSQLVAYGEDEVGRRIYTVRVKNLADESMFEDRLEGAQGGAVWSNDNQFLFYIKKDPQTLLGYQVYRHKLGTKQAEDVLVFEEKDTSFYTSLSKSLDDSLILIHHSSTITKGVSLLDANKPEGQFELFYPLQTGHEYSIDKTGEEFFVRTNKDAPNFRLMKTTFAERNDINKWQQVIAHDENSLLTNVIAFKDKLAISERRNGLDQIRILDLKTNEFHNISFKDSAYTASLNRNLDPNSPTLRYSYSSMTTPNSIYDYNFETGQSELKKQDKVLGDFDSNNYQSERISIKAQDGKMIPVSLFYRKDLFKKDGTNPLYQYGYGSYGATMTPRFVSNWISLVDRGFVVAIAHIRGSQMLGRSWYENGKMFNKINTFTDFIDVTDGLVKQQYAAKDKVFIAGGSAGGLLMGAVINMAPEKYRGVASHVPFVDVVTTMLDESIPLTTNEYNEWGNPNNKDSYDYMLSYSPYDQLKKQNYPNMLVTTGLHDSQVQYFEPMKWVAKLREYKTDDNLLLFHTNMEAGHGGSSGRFRRLKQTALEYAFFMDLLGLND